MALTKLKTSGIADDAVTTDKLANAINTERTANTAKVSLGADSVTGAKIADDAVGAEHIEQLDADLSFADSAKAKFGASNDLEISHDGSNSKIHHGGSGGLKVTCDDFQVQKNDGSEWIMRGQADGAVSLYHDNIKKLDTRSDGIIVWGPEGGDAQLRLTADEGDDGADYWRLESNASSNNFNLATHAGGSWEDKVSINSSGKVGIGTTSPTEILHIKEGTNKNLHFTGGIGQIGNVTGFYAVNDANDTIVDIGMTGSTVRFGTIAGERGRFTGDGLCFNGDTAAANALDDYEEGTFTPTISQGGSVSSYTLQRASYTKIGDFVHCQIDLYVSGTGSGDAVRIGGLPFTAKNQNTYAFGGAYLAYSAGAFPSGSNNRALFHVMSQSTEIGVYNEAGQALAGNSTGMAVFGNNEFIFVVSYKAG